MAFLAAISGGRASTLPAGIGVKFAFLKIGEGIEIEHVLCIVRAKSQLRVSSHNKVIWGRAEYCMLQFWFGTLHLYFQIFALSIPNHSLAACSHQSSNQSPASLRRKLLPIPALSRLPMAR